MALEQTNAELTFNSNLILTQNADLLAKYNMIVTGDSSAQVTINYIDGSMSKYATNSSVGLAFLTNASLGKVSVLTYKADVSLGNIITRVTQLDSSIKNYATNASVGTALGPYATNSSVNSALLTNASLGNISLRVGQLDTSIKNYATNASVGLAFLTNSSLAGNYATNASVNSAFLTNSSLAGNYATNASVGLAFASNASLGNISLRVGQLDTSIKNYATNASIGTASFTTNASLATGSVVKEYVPFNNYRAGLKDGSGVNGSMFVQDASIYLKINGFWAMIACTSIGLGI